MFGEFLAWDTNDQRTLWESYLPEGMGWWERAILINEETGLMYTSNRDRTADPEQHFIKCDPATEEIVDRGERPSVLWNGDFIEHGGEQRRGDTFGRCSLMLVHIPAEERREEAR